MSAQSPDRATLEDKDRDELKVIAAALGAKVTSKTRKGEMIDLIMERTGLTVFVEVKTRGPGALDDPAAWVDRRKLGRMRRLAGRWLAEHPSRDHRDCRFDVVAIHWRGFDEGASLEHLAGVE